MDLIKLPDQDSYPASVKVLLWLILLDAILWLVVGVAYLIRYWDSSHTPLFIVIILAVLMVIGAGILLVVRCGLIRRPRIFFYLAIVLFSITAVLFFTDDFGLSDLLALLLNMLILVLLLINYRFFLKGKASPEAS